jgi:hypothetical protein
MPLELKLPDLSEPLTLAHIQEFHADLERYIDGRVVQLRRQYPKLPAVTLRQTLTKGCLCATATGLLKKEPQ